MLTLSNFFLLEREYLQQIYWSPHLIERKGISSLLYLAYHYHYGSKTTGGFELNFRWTSRYLSFVSSSRLGSNSTTVNSDTEYELKLF